MTNVRANTYHIITYIGWRLYRHYADVLYYVYSSKC